MKCENCGHLVSVGYEYPEYYCELGIADIQSIKNTIQEKVVPFRKRKE